MTQRVLLTAIVFLIINVGVFGAGGDLPGTGSENDPYLIEDAADFAAFANPDSAEIYWASGVYAALMTQLDLSETTYTGAVIAADTNPDNLVFSGTPYSGIFDGNGYTISQLTIKSDPGIDHLGLFGMVQGATIKNVVLTDVLITSDAEGLYIGALCGYSDEAEIFDSLATGVIEEAGIVVGGLVGYCEEGKIDTCYADVRVSGQDQLGGFVGHNEQIISNCYARGDVSGNNEVGGFCGKNIEGDITFCYSTGKPTGIETVGGFCAVSTGPTDDGCFWDTTTSETTVSALATGRETDRMQRPDDYQLAGWFFIETYEFGQWHMPYEAVGYPMLVYQKDVPGDVTGRYGVDVDDVMTFSQCWLAEAGNAYFNPDCDLEQDTTAGKIAIEDITILFDHWLEGIH